MMTTLFSSITDEDKTKAIQKLVEESSPRDHFFLMIILSVLMATFGLLIDNASVIIGSMLIAPILSPILSISLGIVMSDQKLIRRSIYTLGKSIVMSIIASGIVALLFIPQIDLGETLNGEILARMEPSVLFAAIAVIAGLAASFASVKSDLNNALPGIAISVALIPPLAVTGIGLARFDWGMMTSAFLLFLTNTTAIVFASMVIFSLMNLYRKRPVADRAVEKDESTVREERRQAENSKEQEETI